MAVIAGETLGLRDAVRRHIFNHTAPNTDVLHRYYVGLNEGDVVSALVAIQDGLTELMRPGHQKGQAASWRVCVGI